ncbi:MAG: DNA polymerase IV [Lautropia sp.]
MASDPASDGGGGARRIAHVDMDAFYASVELLRRPDLAGLPVAIGGRGDPRSRGVVTTATYAARAFGIRSGMPLRTARELCPQCVFLPVDFAAYRAVSRRFKAAIATVADRIEDRGIDEVYVDLGAMREDSATLGRRLKDAIREATGLGCSVGIAPNKLLAKIASDLDKPDGLTVIDARAFAERIMPLAPARINGIGPKAARRLAEMGIGSIGALATADPHALQLAFGLRYARWLLRAAAGIDERALSLGSEPRSRSRETTFERDLVPGRHDDEIREALGELSQRVAGDLATGRHLARTIGIKIRFRDFTTVTRDLSLARPTAAPLDIEQAALACLARVELARAIRLIGVRASGIDTPQPQTAALF